MPPILGREDLRIALPMLFTLALATTFCAVGLIGGGIYLAIGTSASNTAVELFGSKITTGNVGLAMAFIGAVSQLVVVGKLLSTVTDLIKVPGPSGLPPAPQRTD